MSNIERFTLTMQNLILQVLDKVGVRAAKGITHIIG